MLQSMFKSPKAPKPQALPAETPTPTIDQAANRAESDLRLRRRKGRSAYMFSGNKDVGAPTVGVKTLTGQ